jgi:uroporphyrinogen-III synthase
LKVGGSRVNFRVVVTRAAQDAAQWVEKLTRAGFQAEALPLIEIAATTNAADVHGLQAAWQNLERYAACMFVSGNAAEYFFKSNRHYPQSSRALAATYLIADANSLLLPPSLRFLAPGPGTAAALVAQGVPAAQIDSPLPDALQFDSQALWDVVGLRDWQGKRVLLVRGHSASVADLPGACASAVQPRDWLTQKWQAAGSQVDVVTVYQRQAPRLSHAQTDLARAASIDGSVWLFSSSEAVAHLRDAPGLKGADWRNAVAIATHPRILDAVRAAGFGVALASRPAFPDIVQALRSIESTAP